MTSQLIKSGLFNCPSSPVRAKVECCKSRDLFGYQIKDCSATRILFLSITGRHPWPTGSLMGGGCLPLCKGAVSVFYSPSWLGSLVYTVNYTCVDISSSEYVSMCIYVYGGKLTTSVCIYVCMSIFPPTPGHICMGMLSVHVAICILCGNH